MNRLLNKFLHNRKGTAEVIGSVMFIVIIIFFFSNVYLWHDQATRQMNSVLSDKMNSPVTINWKPDNRLLVNNSGGVDVVLSRLWVTNDDLSHSFLDLTHDPDTAVPVRVAVKAGSFVEMQLGITDGLVNWVSVKGKTYPIDPIDTFPTDEVTFKIVTTLGNMASVSNPENPLSSGGSSGQGLQNIIGDFVPDYHSVQWGIPIDGQISDADWSNAGNWEIPSQPKKTNLVWRINFTYYGQDATMTIDKSSTLCFNPISNSQNQFVLAYIVNSTRSGTSSIISHYLAGNPAKVFHFENGYNITLYFGSTTEDGSTIIQNDDFGNNLAFMMNLIIYQYQGSYAQTFPMFAIRVT